MTPYSHLHIPVPSLIRVISLGWAEGRYRDGRREYGKSAKTTWRASPGIIELLTRTGTVVGLSLSHVAWSSTMPLSVVAADIDDTN